MKISKTHWIIWWAYLHDRLLADEDKPFILPEQTNLCSIFWRSVLLVPIKMFFIGFMLLVVCVFVILLSPFILITIIIEKSKKSKFKWFEVISAKISDFKNKTCTRIEIK